MTPHVEGLGIKLRRIQSEVHSLGGFLSEDHESPNCIAEHVLAAVSIAIGMVLLFIVITQIELKLKRRSLLVKVRLAAERITSYAYNMYNTLEIVKLRSTNYKDCKRKSSRV